MDKKNSIKIIADAIREGRKRRGWGQKDLAAFIGADTSLISKWETYRNVPSGDDLFDIAKELDIVHLLFPEYFPDKAEDAPSLRKEVEQLKQENLEIKQRMAKVEKKLLECKCH